MFAVAKQDYEDARFNFTIDMKDGKPDFSTIKRPEFDAAKAAGELDASGGNRAHKGKIGPYTGP